MLSSVSCLFRSNSIGLDSINLAAAFYSDFIDMKTCHKPLALKLKS